MMETLSRPAQLDFVPMTIDHPLSGEVVTAPQYALRITAGDETQVRVSIDGGSWQPCRRASGHFWYDWEGYSSGYHLLSVQVVGPDGRVRALEARHVSVRLAGGDEPVRPIRRGRRLHV